VFQHVLEKRGGQAQVLIDPSISMKTIGNSHLAILGGEYGIQTDLIKDHGRVVVAVVKSYIVYGEHFMKTYKQLMEEMTSAGGGIAGMHQSVTPTDGLPEIGGREADRIRVNKKKKKTNETFAGCRVFTLTSEEYSKCMRGRNKYERWNKKMNMEELNNQDIRTYSHRNPGQPVVIKDGTTGIMAYLIPPTTR
jgi:hypothetical protein